MAETKTPSQVTPFLVAALICDVAAEDPASRKKSLIGIFDRVQVGSFPTNLPMSLYIKMTDADGYYPIEIEYVFVNTDEVLGKAVGELEVNDRTVSVDLYIPFPPLLIREPGRYAFRIKASGMFLGATFIDAVQHVLPQ